MRWEEDVLITVFSLLLENSRRLVDTEVNKRWNEARGFRYDGDDLEGGSA